MLEVCSENNMEYVLSTFRVCFDYGLEYVLGMGKGMLWECFEYVWSMFEYWSEHDLSTFGVWLEYVGSMLVVCFENNLEYVLSTFRLCF